jgi:hypothetical protein
LVSVCTIPGCPAWRSRSGLLVKPLLLGVKPREDVRSQHGHKSMRALLGDGSRTGVHGDVSLPWVHVRRPWWRTPVVVGGGTIGSRGGVARVVAITISTVVIMLATITVVATVIVLVPVVVVVVILARYQGQ